MPNNTDQIAMPHIEKNNALTDLFTRRSAPVALRSHAFARNAERKIAIFTVITKTMMNAWRSSGFADYAIQGFIMEGLKMKIVSPIKASGTTPADALDTMNRLVEMGKWKAFYVTALCNFNIPDNDADVDAQFIAWLFSPTPSGVYRICELAGEWMKEEGR